MTGNQSSVIANASLALHLNQFKTCRGRDPAHPADLAVSADPEGGMAPFLRLDSSCPLLPLPVADNRLSPTFQGQVLLVWAALGQWCGGCKLWLWRIAHSYR